MQRLLNSSKFWALVIGGVSLLLTQLFGQNNDFKELLDNISVLYMVAAPIVLAVMNGIEDAFGDGIVDLEELARIVKELLDEIQPTE